MRVVTWNLWWRFGPWADRQKAILAVLRELRPDVVGLQEVWAADDGSNLAQWLAGELGLHCAFAASEAPGRWQRRIGDDTVGIGNAVLSRWPVTRWAALRLPAPEEFDDGRLAFHALLDAPGHPVPFFTTHLNSGAHAAAVRREQAAALAEFVARHRVGTGFFPPVVTGDFNALPDSAEVRLLTRATPAGAALRDAWEHADPAAPSATWDGTNPYIPGPPGPGARIDHVHVGPPGPAGLGRVRAARRAGDGPVDGVWPSDHAAVVVDLDGP
ncbi:Endonuclease/exonuclease/phosphatase [Streptomyces ambofaciens ATCC 23877]|uniref:Endonuclease/exonuclease/phosphatase n=1 Tax=Streptomyces ambofaciens (strain ATCC 23877 / 3486 / DSM 40053 / JCM 4204 / NBRC 12836 / NRRL B-2516) TaxID=278992 RepID=A0A0K2ATP3_STRA7|nr:endonuclease/exonuclease/phosphatase family protein [Streptomyces ambofaciens]AKZ56353.1 Endonuclease/exonuclease/phosphatase [Streptomyces ambofaciens ATCC 23877]